MVMPSNLGMYGDILQVFQAVKSRGQITMDFPTKSQAVRFRHRAYHYRKLLHTMQAVRLGNPNAYTTTEFDDLIIRFHPTRPMTLVFSQVSLQYTMRDETGAEVAPPPIDSLPAEHIVPAGDLALDLIDAEEEDARLEAIANSIREKFSK